MTSKPARPEKKRLSDDLSAAYAQAFDYAIKLERWAVEMDAWLKERVLPVLREVRGYVPDTIQFADDAPEPHHTTQKLKALIAELEGGTDE